MDFKNKIILFTAAIFSAVAVAKTQVEKEVPAHVPGELIVKFKEGSFKTIGLINSLQAETVKTFRSSGAHLIRVPKAFDISSIKHSLSQSQEVEYVELNHIYYLNALPDDPDFDRLYGLNNEGKTGGTDDADIDAPEAWEINTGSHDVIVGVVDTGIDYNHEDLKDNMWANPGESGLDEDGNDKSTNGIDDDENGYVDDHRGWDFINGDNDPMDGHSHGTHVAGTIGAAGNNGVGVAGVNWDVSLVGIKIFSDSGSTSTDVIIEAIEYTTAVGIHVTNNSWGGGGFNQALHDAIEEANDEGVLFVAAAGNSRNNNDRSPYYPATYDLDNIITVAATDHNDRLASFSSYGQEEVEIAAPGVDVYSTTPGNRYGSKSGTSMATPHVTGLVALVMAQFPDLDLEGVKDRVVNTGDKISSLSSRVISGARINALGALEIDQEAPNAPENLEVDNISLRSLQLSFDPAGDDGDEGQATSYDVRISESEMNDDSDFKDATIIQMEMTAENGQMIAQINGIPMNFDGFIAVRAIDNVGNVSPVSENIPFQMLEVELLMENSGDTMSGFSSVDQPWGVMSHESEMMISDSPTGSYSGDTDVSITSRSFSVEQSFYAISFDHIVSFEDAYDFGALEVSVDGGNFQQIARFTGEADLATEFHDISEVVSEGGEFQIRFRVTSDGSVQKDGWMLDNISLMTAESNISN